MADADKPNAAPSSEPVAPTETDLPGTTNRRPSQQGRQLFGAISPAEVDLFLLQEEERLQAEYRIKYNFDFANHQPLEGKYEWQPLPAQDPGTHPPHKQDSER